MFSVAAFPESGLNVVKELLLPHLLVCESSVFRILHFPHEVPYYSSVCVLCFVWYAIR